MRNPLREICTAGSVRGEALGVVRRTYTGTKLETADTDKGIPTDDIGASSTRKIIMAAEQRGHLHSEVSSLPKLCNYQRTTRRSDIVSKPSVTEMK